MPVRCSPDGTRIVAPVLTETTLLLLATVCLVAWLWSNAMRARERAISTCRRACSSCEVQLLDDTVSLATLGIRRGTRGRLELRRVYRFEYSTDGRNRLEGSVAFLGATLELVHLPERMSVS